jgi:argininosuccinate lyase
MAKKLWGGRFSKRTDPLVEEFTKSIQYDYKIALEDILGSMSHVEILADCHYLFDEEATKLNKALSSIFDDIYKKMGEGKFKPDDKTEDIHTYIQNLLEKKVGDLALKLHTARSRNDQVAFATKYYCKGNIIALEVAINKLLGSIKKLAKENRNIIMPGFTHMQHAQPVYLKDYLAAYIEMFERDKLRSAYISQNMKISMGAGALAGTPIDATEYNKTASKHIKELVDVIGKFNIQATTNSLDVVSDRDFVIEIISSLSIIAMHLSRLSEDLIIWSTKEFDFIEIDETFCTGSSLMPQKKNPDVLELTRGYAGRLYGNLVSVLTMMKGLPLTYNRDMQLDKEPLFNSFEIVFSELKVLTGLMKTLKFNKVRIEEQLKDEALYATDLVYYLVDKKIPFKNAHTIIGKLIKYSIDNDIQIKEMPEGLLKKFSDKLVKKEIVKLFDPLVSVKSKKSIKR